MSRIHMITDFLYMNAGSNEKAFSLTQDVK